MLDRRNLFYSCQTIPFAEHHFSFLLLVPVSVVVRLIAQDTPPFIFYISLAWIKTKEHAGIEKNNSSRVGQRLMIHSVTSTL